MKDIEDHNNDVDDYLDRIDGGGVDDIDVDIDWRTPTDLRSEMHRRRSLTLHPILSGIADHFHNLFGYFINQGSLLGSGATGFNSGDDLLFCFDYEEVFGKNSDFKGIKVFASDVQFLVDSLQLKGWDVRVDVSEGGELLNILVSCSGGS